MKPALTAEEWEEGRYGYDRECDEAGEDAYTAWIVSGGEVRLADTLVGVEGPSAHALAALCLHGQEFGFTRADVEALKYRGTGYDETHDQNALDDLADRLEALLPPEAP